jgi:Fe-Mn family superoxide dismutase
LFNLNKITNMKFNSLLFLLAVVGFLGCQTQAQEPVTAPFELHDLPYAFNALEPHIDAQTMEVHYTKHHAGYTKNFNKALEDAGLMDVEVEEILANVSKHGTSIRNNGGGYYNHNLFWSVLTPDATEPSEELLAAINKAFGSLDVAQDKLNEAAAGRFGSGWAWLIVKPNGELAITSTPNQDNPLMDVVDERGIPIFGIDVWEHAYYLKYQNKRGDYLSAIWNVVNWEEVSRRYAYATPAEG